MSDFALIKDTFSEFSKHQKKLFSIIIGKVVVFLLVSSILTVATVTIGQPLSILVAAGFLFLFALFTLSKIAIPLHRFFLLSNPAEDRVQTRRVRTRDVLQYSGALTSICAIMGAIVFLFALAAVSLMVGSSSGVALMDLPFGVYGVAVLVLVLALYFGFRLSPLLSASAVDVRLSITEAWNTTHDLSGAFLKALIAFGGVALVFGAAIGSGTFYAIEAASLGQVLALAVGGFIALQVAFWVATILSLVFISVIYDQVIEDRLVEDRMKVFQAI